MSATKIDELMDQPTRVAMIRRGVETLIDRADPLLHLYRPYVDGLENLPRDGRFLLVGNHTQSGYEGGLIPVLVRREIGKRVRPLTERMMGRFPGPVTDVLAACGAVVGAPDSCRELMRHNEPILVFPGGGREISKFKDELYQLRWQGRSGFARLSVENSYPIVAAALVGGDDVYESLISRDSRAGRLSMRITAALSGRSDMAPPVVRGVGPTLIPRPKRMYLRFSAPIDTTKPENVSEEKWVEDVKQQTQRALEESLVGLLELRSTDPFCDLNPLKWKDAVRPTVDGS